MDEIINAYNKIVGKSFSSLTEKELSILYVIELWQDGMDSEHAKELLKLNDPLFIKLQLKYTFDYKENAIIQSIS